MNYAILAFAIKLQELGCQYRPISPKVLRQSDKKTANFLSYTRGSAGELRTQIYIGMDVGYIDKETGRHWLQEAEEISKCYTALPEPSAPE